jgi:hypothetical protein
MPDSSLTRNESFWFLCTIANFRGSSIIKLEILRVVARRAPGAPDGGLRFELPPAE